MDSLVQEARAGKIEPPLIYDVAQEAMVALSSSGLRILAVVMNPSIGANETIQVIRACKQFRQNVPLLFLQDGDATLDDNMLNRLGVIGVLKKPIKYADIIAVLSDQNHFSKQDSPQGSVAPMFNKLEGVLTGPNNNEVHLQDHEFISVNARDFLDGSKSTFSLYLRLESGRYLKLLQAGDVMQKERLKRYLEKGVVLFFIKKREHEKYLEYCDSLVSDLLRMQSAPVSLKISHTLKLGEEVTRLYSQVGLRESNLHHACKFVENLSKVTKQIALDQNSSLYDFLRDAAFYDHGVATSFAASLLIQALDIFSSDPVETIGLASLFHDIGLKSMDPRWMHEDESKMTESEREIYRTHPSEGGKLLKKIPGIKPAVIQGIEHHHVRKNRGGFPQLAGVGSLSLVSEIVGASDEICHIMEEINRNPSALKSSFQNMCTLRIYNNFSHKVVAALKKIFPKMAA